MQKTCVCCGGFERLALWSLLAALLLSGCNHARTNLVNYSKSAGKKVFVLNEITPNQAKAFLNELNLGTVSLQPDYNAVLVTGTPEDLEKAGVVLDLVDNSEKFVIEPIAPDVAFGLIEKEDKESPSQILLSPESARTMPGNDRIAQTLGDVSIGTFASPPKFDKHARAIIDIQDDSVVAIFPENRLEELRKIVGLGVEAIEHKKRVLPVPDPTDRYLEQVSEFDPVIEAVKNHQDVQPEHADKRRSKSIPDESPLRITDSDRLVASSKAQLEGQVESSTGLENPAPSDTGQEDGVTESSTVLSEESSPKNKEITPSSPEKATKTSKVEQIYQIEPLPNGDDILELELPERIDLIRLLDLVGEYLHLDYMYDPDKIKNQMVTLKLHGKLRGEIRVKDLYSLLESVLNFKGFVMARHEGNIVTIVPVADVMQVDPELVDPNSKTIEAGDTVVTRMFELQYIDTFSAINLLENMKLTVAVSPIAEIQTLIVTSYTYRMPRIERLLKMVDQPGKLRKVRFKQLQYITAKMLAEKLKALSAELETAGVTIAMSTQASQRPGGAGPLPTPVQQPTGAASGKQLNRQAVYLDADDRTNRLLIIGYEEQLDTIEQLVETFDVPKQSLRIFKAYELVQVDAGEAMDKLEKLGVIGEAGRAQKTPVSTPKPPKPASPFATETPSQPGGPLVEKAHVLH